jgi:diguanylate cyclase (GGDEF)-like protein/PAS domain S-box-containing protein
MNLNTDIISSRAALKISLIYASFSLVWIFFSDALLFSLIKNPETITDLQTLKGWFFVIASSLILYFLLLKEIKLSQQSQKKYIDIFNTTTEALFIVQANNDKIIEVNPAATDLLGFTTEELKQCRLADLNLNPENTSYLGSYTKQIRTKSDNLLSVEISRQTFDNEKNSEISVAVRDITDRKRNEDVLRSLAETGSINSGDTFKAIVHQLASSLGTRYAMIASLHPVNKKTVTTLAVWDGKDFADNFSYSLEGTPCNDVITQTTACSYPNNIQQLFPNDAILADLNIQGYLGVPLRNNLNEAIGILALLDDKPLTIKSNTIELLNSLATRASFELERKAVDEKLKQSARVFSDTHEGILITDTSGTIIDVNPTFCTVTQYPREEVLGKNPGILNSGKQGPEFYKKMWQQLDSDGSWQGEVWNRKKSGELYAELLTISSLSNDDGEIINYVGMFTDITNSKKQQEQLEFMAQYDVLTKLPNRILFADRFLQAVAHCKRNETLLAVCFLDLDHFKPVNDTHGHLVGDQVLIEVANRIQSNIREEDTVSRQGGDEFTIFLTDIKTPRDGGLLFDRIQHSLEQPYYIEEHTINISSSMGVTFHPLDDFDLDTLLRHADQAMYQAKMEAKGSYSLFNIEQNRETFDKHLRLNEVIQAFEQGELSLYFQPKVNMKTGKVIGAEGLLRWTHPEKGMIPPLTFLPVIEESEFETTLGNWVIEQALKQLQRCNKNGIELEISINISSHHLQSANFFAMLESALARHPDINSNHLQLEILESSVLSDVNNIRTIINSCRDKLGVNFALDDFGTGYSSLTHLRNLPVQTIKIDQSFVQGMLADPNDFAIIDGTMGLADSFKRKIIAEGVETTAHGLMLLIIGCELAQGYSIARPMPASNFSDWLSNYKPNQEWLNYAKEKQTPKKQKLQSFTLFIQHWHSQIKEILQAEIPEEKSISHFSNLEKSHCHIWINREQQEQTFDIAWLEQLELAHTQSHVLAQDLLHNHDMDNSVKSDLEHCFDHIDQLLTEQISPHTNNVVEIR